MLLSIGDQEYVITLRNIEPYKPMKTQEPIQLSKIPDAHASDGTLAPIERDDWPAPPAAAAAYPDLCICLFVSILLEECFNHHVSEGAILQLFGVKCHII